MKTKDWSVHNYFMKSIGYACVSTGHTLVTQLEQLASYLFGRALREAREAS